MPMEDTENDPDVVIRTAPAVPSGRSAFFSNLRQGLRMACLRAPQPGKLYFSLGQLLAMLGLGLALNLAYQVFYVGFDGEFRWRALPEYLFLVPPLLLAWALGNLSRDDSAGARYLIALYSLALPVIAVSPLVFMVYPYTESASVWLQWLSYYGLMLWYVLAAALAAVRIFALRGMRAGLAVICVLSLLSASEMFLESNQSLWSARVDPEESAAYARRYGLLANEDNFYRQPQLLDKALAALQPQRPGVTDLYFVAMAGWAPQDVFMREVNSVTQLFEQRFDARGHTLRLVNNPATVATLPIASRTALRLSLARIAKLMNPDEDVLFLFMTSHGSHDHKFSLDFGVMSFKDIDPAALKKLLDESGIKYRVIVVSACYSGGFVDALKNDDTLVITAAAKDRNSFGCSNENDYTYFGKAYFDEALRKTYSFTEAFKLAAPVIAAREKQEDFNPSEPQIALGKNIAPLLDAFAAQREKDAQAKPTEATGK